MTKFYLSLCAMASALLPCQATQPSATAVFQEMAVVPKVSPATLDQRSAALGSLALLPAGTEAYWSILNPGRSGKDILSLPIVRGLLSNGQGDVCSFLAGVGDSVVGLGPGTAAMLQRMNAVVPQMEARQIETMMNACFGLPSGVRCEKNASAMRSYVDLLSAAVAKEDLSVTFIARLDPAMMAMSKRQLAEIMDEFHAEKKAGESRGTEEFQGRFAGLDFKGLRFDLAEAMSAVAGGADVSALKERSVYFLWAFSGNRVFLTITQNPAKQIQFAKTPAESVLAGAKSSFADARLASDIRSIAFADAAVIQALYDYNKQDTKGLLQGMAKALTQREDRWGASQVGGFLSAMSSFCREVIDLYNSYGKGDATFVAWKQGGLRMEMTCASSSLYNVQEPLRLASLADLPGNVFYGEGAVTARLASTYNHILGNLGKMAWYGLEAAANMEKAQSPDCPGPGRLQTSVMMARMISPALDKFWTSWQRMGSGLGLQWAVAGDLVAPAFPAGNPQAEKFPPSPRVAAYFPVTDRSAVTAGWQGMVDAADKIGAACGMEQGTIATLMEGAATDRGNGVTDYGLDLGGISLLSSLSDKALVVGNSPDLNAEFFKALAKPASSLRGQAGCVRLGPLADMMKKLGASGVGIGCLDPESSQRVGALLEQSVDGVFTLTTQQDNRVRLQIYVKTK